MQTNEIKELAAKHGLEIDSRISLNEMGIDFLIAFVRDADGKRWVLRIPRRDDLAEQIEKEKQILGLAKRYLSVSVPDWQIASNELIAYPLLQDQPVLTFDPATYAVTWNVDQNSPRLVSSLAAALVELHSVPTEEASAIGVKILTPPLMRREILHNIERVKRELGMSEELESRWRKWLDTEELWPDFSTFVHGDLYAGHILAASDGTVSGFIDWSEGHVDDSSVDFAGHINAFGEVSLRDLIAEYEKAGGKVWPRLFEQIVERHSASPLSYAIFALETGDDNHIQAAKGQLGAA